MATKMSTELDMERIMEIAKRAHSLTTPEQVKEHYKEYAHEYDKAKNIMGMKNDPFIKLFDTLGLPKSAHVLDIGCGTGDNAVVLKRIGYTNVDGLDFSPEMLEVAKTKNVYQKLICAMVAKEVELPIPEKTYDAVVSSGSFCPGHMKWDSFGQIARVVKTGGIIFWNTPEHGHDNGHEHGHGHSHEHAHGHDHEHSHEHKEGHAQCGQSNGHQHEQAHQHGQDCHGHKHEDNEKSKEVVFDHHHHGHHGDNQHFVDGFVEQKLWEYLPGYPNKEHREFSERKMLITTYAMKVL